MRDGKWCFEYDNHVIEFTETTLDWMNVKFEYAGHNYDGIRFLLYMDGIFPRVKVMDVQIESPGVS